MFHRMGIRIYAYCIDFQYSAFNNVFFINIWLICPSSDFLPGLYLLSLRSESNV